MHTIDTGEISHLLPRLLHVRCALYMPASNPRALAKAPALPADLIVLDLEDAVADADKDAARAAAAAADLADRLTAIRANSAESAHHAADLKAIAESHAAILVLPKVESTATLDAAAALCNKPIIAMIETGAGLYAAREIAAHPSVIGLFAGTNDLAAEIGVDLSEGREGLVLALQMMVLAARASGKAVLDGVNNMLDDLTTLEAESAEARRFGFTGKTAIHPKQIDPINHYFAPTDAQLEDARALVVAAGGGAERFRGRMVETMHVEAARALLARHNAIMGGATG